MPSSRGSPRPRVESRSLSLQANSLQSEPPGKPHFLGSILTNFMELNSVDLKTISRDLPGGPVVTTTKLTLQGAD